MNVAKKLQSFLQEELFPSNLCILSECPPHSILRDLAGHPQVHTLPCADDMLCNTAMGMAISGAHVLICLSSEQSLASIAANLFEETYGSEFSLALTFLIPSTEILPQHQLPHYVYCQTGAQLLAQCRTHVRANNISAICYNPAAFLILLKTSMQQNQSFIVKEPISLFFSSGLHIDAAKSICQAESRC